MAHVLTRLRYQLNAPTPVGRSPPEILSRVFMLFVHFPENNPPLPYDLQLQETCPGRRSHERRRSPPIRDARRLGSGGGGGLLNGQSGGVAGVPVLRVADDGLE